MLSPVAMAAPRLARMRSTRVTALGPLVPRQSDVTACDPSELPVLARVWHGRDGRAVGPAAAATGDLKSLSGEYPWHRLRGPRPVRPGPGGGLSSRHGYRTCGQRGRCHWLRERCARPGNEPKPLRGTRPRSPPRRKACSAPRPRSPLPQTRRGSRVIRLSAPFRAARRMGCWPALGPVWDLGPCVIGQRSLDHRSQRHGKYGQRRG